MAYILESNNLANVAQGIYYMSAVYRIPTEVLSSHPPASARAHSLGTSSFVFFLLRFHHPAWSHFVVLAPAFLHKSDMNPSCSLCFGSCSQSSFSKRDINSLNNGCSAPGSMLGIFWRR